MILGITVAIDRIGAGSVAVGVLLVAGGADVTIGTLHKPGGTIVTLGVVPRVSAGAVTPNVCVTANSRRLVRAVGGDRADQVAVRVDPFVLGGATGAIVRGVVCGRALGAGSAVPLVVAVTVAVGQEAGDAVRLCAGVTVQGPSAGAVARGVRRGSGIVGGAGTAVLVGVIPHWARGTLRQWTLPLVAAAAGAAGVGVPRHTHRVVAARAVILRRAGQETARVVVSLVDAGAAILGGVVGVEAVRAVAALPLVPARTDTRALEAAHAVGLTVAVSRVGADSLAIWVPSVTSDASATILCPVVELRTGFAHVAFPLIPTRTVAAHVLVPHHAVWMVAAVGRSCALEPAEGVLCVARSAAVAAGPCEAWPWADAAVRVLPLVFASAVAVPNQPTHCGRPGRTIQ